MLKIRDQIIWQALKEGKHVIVDDTNLQPKHVATLEALAPQVREQRGTCAFVVKDFTDVPIETCIEQDLKRPNSVGERVIRSMWREHLALAVHCTHGPTGTRSCVGILSDR